MENKMYNISKISKKYLIIVIVVFFIALFMGRKIYLSTNYPYKNVINDIANEHGLTIVDFKFANNSEYDWYDVELEIEGKDSISDEEWYAFFNDLPYFEVMEINSYSIEKVCCNDISYDKEGLDELQRSYYKDFCEKLKNNDYNDLEKYKELISPKFNSIGYIVDNRDSFKVLTTGYWNAIDLGWEYEDKFKWDYYKGSSVLGFFVTEDEYSGDSYIGRYEDSISNIKDLFASEGMTIKGSDHDDWIIHFEEIDNGYYVKEYPAIEYVDNTLKFVHSN